MLFAVPTPTSTQPHRGPDLTVLLAAERFVVVNKPPGMLSVPGKGEDKAHCAASRVRELFPACSGPLVVHRLDMDTSGLLVFGLDPDAQRDLSMQFEARTVYKRYSALVDGVPPAQSGTIDLPIRPDLDDRPVQVIDRALGRPSLTRWRLLSVETDRSRLELEPVTGRTHQLRVHLAAVGLPILGDVLYGPQPLTHALAERLCLHASVLEFNHPGAGPRVRVLSPAPF